MNKQYFFKISASILLDKIQLPKVRYTTKVTLLVNFTRKGGPNWAPFKVLSYLVHPLVVPLVHLISAQMPPRLQTFHYIVPSYYSPAIYWSHHIVFQGNYRISAQTLLRLLTRLNGTFIYNRC